MNRYKCFIASSLVFLLGLMCAIDCEAIDNAQLEKGVAITNIAYLRSLEDRGYSIGALLLQSEREGVVSNLDLAKIPAFQPVLASIQSEMADYQKKHPGTGVGIKNFSKRLFDISYLTDNRARFVLVGIINRMDQAFKSPETCGEIRFIYRLAYAVTVENENVASRLPMTINLIYNHKSADSSIDCATIANQWLNGDPLATSAFDRKAFKQLEINLQIVRWPAAIASDFGGRAEYLLKVYKWNGQSFNEAPMDNQIDREKLLADPALLKEMRAWLLQPEIQSQIDKGTVQIPEKYLARRAFSLSPGGINRSSNRPFSGLFTEKDLALLNYENLENIKSQIGRAHV